MYTTIYHAAELVEKIIHLEIIMRMDLLACCPVLNQIDKVRSTFDKVLH